MNPFGIHEPCINIEKNELIFEQYIMTLNQEKYDIKVRNDDAINCNQILFDFMLRTFNRLDCLYLRERCLLTDAIIEDKMRKRSAVEIEKLTEKYGPKRK